MATGVLLLGLGLGVAALWGGRGPLGPAPDVSFQIIDGRGLEWAQLRGRPVLVTFWSTSCAQCIEEMPRLADIYRRLAPRGLEIIGVAMPFDRPDHVVEVARREAVPYPIALDVTGELAMAFGGIPVTPASFLVDGRGVILLRHLGPLDSARLEERIDKLLRGD